MTNNSINDYTERQRALNPEESFIVQAPAGSGKTELLIQRYLGLLSKVEHPEEIVAITFTRKAAAEMQGRIINALENARSGLSPKDDATRITSDIALIALEQDRNHNWHLENNPGRLRIQTIDSLCAWLTRQMPVLSRFGGQPEIIEDASEIYREAATNTLTELAASGNWPEESEILLAHLDNNLPKARDMLANMLAKRDQWLRHVAKDIRREELESSLKNVVESSLKNARDSFPEEHITEFITCIRYAADNLARDNNQSLIVFCRDLNHLPGTSINELSKWLGIANICLTGTDQWRKRLDKNSGFPATTQGKDMKDQFQSLLSRLSEYENLHARLVDIRNLPPVTYSDNQWQVINALFELLVLADAQLRINFSERNQIDFIGVTQAAINALGTEDFPTDLALHLDYRIQHLLIDEFQDVSTNQYNLLQQLTAGWSGEDGHTLFLVGDPMQSIYRFREAEVGYFMETWQKKRLGQVPLSPLNLSVNFRSQAGIVTWVNEIFREVFPAIPDSTSGAVSYVEAEAFHQALIDAPVEMHPLLDRDDKREADIIEKLIRTSRKNFPDEKIAILVRSRSHLGEIVSHFKNSDLRFRAVEIETLGQRSVIQDLYILTRALNHFADRIAWFAILRAPWCGLTLNDLLALTGETDDKTIWECMQDENRLLQMTREGLQRLLKIRAVLELSIAEKGRRSLRRTVESVWMSLGGPATIADETDLDNVETYFELLDEHEKGGEIRNRNQFLQRMEKLFAAPDIHADDSLQIMTIHKAKGLEFDTVIIPGLSRSIAKDEPQLLIWSENPREMRQELLLAPIKEAGEKESRIYNYLRRLEKKKKRNEEARLLYVATTRAKRQLHLLASANVKVKDTREVITPPAKDSLLIYLWPMLKDRFKEALRSFQPGTGIDKKTSDISNTFRRVQADWILPVSTGSIVWQSGAGAGEQTEIPVIPEYVWAGETIRHIGTVVHKFIQQIAEDGIDKWNDLNIRNKKPLYKMYLKRSGVLDAELEWASQRVVEALLNMITDERGRWILYKGHREQKTEYSISGIYTGKIVNVIIDRTFVDEDGTRWIIDYKTSRHEGPDINAFLDQEQERYKPQMEKYGTLMRGLDDRAVRLGLYFPILKGWREVNSNLKI